VHFSALLLSGTENSYRFDLFAVLIMPRGTVGEAVWSAAAPCRSSPPGHRDLQPGGRAGACASARRRCRAVRPPGLRGPSSGARLQHQPPPIRTRRPGRPWRD